MVSANEKTNMELEITEQVKTIPMLLNRYIDFSSGKVNFDIPKNVSRIVLVASGSSYHCARFAVDFFEKYTNIETRAIYSSEFLLKHLIPHDEDSLYIFITQSGETSDTLKSVERVQQYKNVSTLCITNVEESTIWKMCDYKVACTAGVEKGIAATKSLTAQFLCVILVGLKILEQRNGVEAIKKYEKTLSHLPKVVEASLNIRDEIRKLANVLVDVNTIAIAGDGISYSLAKEATLKMKETSYKNICAVMFGEFMHGHVAVLNDKNSALIYLAANELSQRAVSNLNNIRNDYNPKLVIIGPTHKDVNVDYNLNVTCEDEIQQVFADVVIFQQLALEVALKLNRNVDNPIGLHKVVVDNNV